MKTQIRRVSRVLAAFAALAGTGAASADWHEELKTFAEGLVYRVEASAGQGSAVLVEIDKEGFGYFATDYHVLQGTKRVVITDVGFHDVAQTHDVTGVYRSVGEDLAILKVRLPKGRHFEQLGAEVTLVPDAQGKEALEGVAVGYAPMAGDRPFDSRIRIYGLRTANFLKINDPQWTPPPGEKSAGGLMLRVLGADATLAGMSGGLVVDRDRHFGGIIFGRLPDAVNLMIPGRLVLDAVQVAKKPGSLKPFGPGLFQASTPFTREVVRQLALDYVLDAMDWRFFDKWTLLFEDDPSPFIGAFQEVTIDLPPGGAQGLRLEVDGESRPKPPAAPGKPDEPSKHHLDLWINGQIHHDRDAVDLDLSLGENLLVLTKSLDASDDLDLKGLFEPNPLSVTFSRGGKTVYVVKRSLPAIISGYPIYVTVRNGAGEDGLDPYNARLAVRRDFLEDLVNRVPFWVPLQFGPTPEGTELRGRLAFEGADFGTVEFHSAQTFDLAARGKVEIKRGRFSGYGLRLEAQPRDLTLDLRGRLQFTANRKDWLYISARALGASGRDPFKIPIAEGGAGRLGLSLDVGGILRELMVCQVNNRLLLPANPETPALEKVGRFFETLGLGVGVPGWKCRPQQVMMSRDGKHDWIVFTFRVFQGDAPPNGPLPVGHQPTLLPDLADRPGQVIELVAHDIPGAAALRFAAKPPRDPMLDRALGQARVETLTLSADEPKQAPRPAVSTTALDDEGEKVGARFQEVFAERLTNAARVVEIQVDPEPVLRLLQDCIEAPKLDLTSQGGLILAASDGPSGPSVSLRQAGGSLGVAARGEIRFGDGRTFSGVSLSVERLDVRGEPDRKRATGTLAGRLKFDHARIGGDLEIREADCSFKAQVDSAGPDILTFECKPTRGDFRYKEGGFQPLPDAGIRIVVGKGRVQVKIRPE